MRFKIRERDKSVSIKTVNACVSDMSFKISDDNKGSYQNLAGSANPSPFAIVRRGRIA